MNNKKKISKISPRWSLFIAEPKQLAITSKEKTRWVHPHQGAMHQFPRTTARWNQLPRGCFPGDLFKFGVKLSLTINLYLKWPLRLEQGEAHCKTKTKKIIVFERNNPHIVRYLPKKMVAWRGQIKRICWVWQNFPTKRFTCMFGHVTDIGMSIVMLINHAVSPAGSFQLNFLMEPVHLFHMQISSRSTSKAVIRDCSSRAIAGEIIKMIWYINYGKGSTGCNAQICID